MEKTAFELLEQSESSWWGRGRAFFIRRILNHFFAKDNAVILDIGAGYGASCALLSSYGTADAFEVELSAAEVCKKRPYKKVILEEAELKKNAGAYDLIAAFDVIEHIEDDTAFVKLFVDLLRPHGNVVATVPAFSFLWSEHDVIHHHFRRYSKKEIISLFEQNGFQVIYAGYWNFFLFPAALLARKVFGISGGEAHAAPLPINIALTLLLRIESLLAPLFSLPCGTGIIIYARKV